MAPRLALVAHGRSLPAAKRVYKPVRIAGRAAQHLATFRPILYTAGVYIGMYMASYELIITGPGVEGTHIRIRPEGVRIGRAPDMDVVLNDPLVSRHHAWIGVEAGALVIRDNNSRNGASVNGVRTVFSALDGGDTITIGNHTLDVVKKKDLSSTSTLIPPHEASALQEAIIAEDRGGRLPILYQAAQLLGSVFDIDDLLNGILALIFDALPVKRGYILTAASVASEAEVRAQRVDDPRSRTLPLSRTLIEHVFTHESAVLTANAQEDERFELSESIVGHGIRGAMCAPLCGRKGCVGAIYVDAGNAPQPFTNADLELLTAIGRVVGVAVENARLYQENLERERLAAIGQATAGLGHCVKNIVTAMKAGGEFMDMAIDKGDLGWVHRGWPLVKRAVDRIEALMMNLLTFSRERQPELQPADLNDLCSEIVEVVRHKAEGQKVSVSFDPGPIGVVFIDAREIYRVVLNLVTNAIEACEKREDGSGRVRIATNPESGGVTFSVQDNGMGIPPDILPKLAQAFVSSKGSRGTGLGLACSYKIVREHGGDITVDTQVGLGTTFTVHLPNRTVTNFTAQR